MFTILGAGLSGLSVADHLSKKNIPFRICEGKSHGGGHTYSEKVDGFTWDEGPHVSFTKSEYVREYFAHNCDNEFLEYPVNPTNYYKGSWIPHPTQCNLYAIPEPLRTACLQDISTVRESLPKDYKPENYQEWLEYAFGKTFSNIFPESYTIKYWTTEAKNLSTDWIGTRVYFPDIAEVVESAKGPLNKQMHYFNKIRYPKFGGFYSYMKNIEESLPVEYSKELQHISFEKRQLSFNDGETINYDKIVNTIPLPELIQMSDAPEEIKAQAKMLECSQVLIVNVTVNHPPRVDNHWIYVYDEDMFTTRINFTDLLSPNNGQEGKCGIQVEVYFSKYRPIDKPHEHYAEKVVEELIKMGLIEGHSDVDNMHTRFITYANVIFDIYCKEALNNVLNWLSNYGLKREADDLSPMTDWDDKFKEEINLGDIILAGRFGQWKYYWTDDCVLRGKLISEKFSL